MKHAIPFLMLLLAAPAVRAQDDYELANALAERGWTDLAEELYRGIIDSPSLSPDKRADGQYGLARLKVYEAQRASGDEKSKLYDVAIKQVRDFLKKNPKHPRRGEALSDIGFLYQSKGRSLVAMAKGDPSLLPKAETAFGEAEKLFLDLVDQLKKTQPQRPQSNDDKAGMARYEAWEEKMMYAKYNYAVSLFSHAETFRNTPAKREDMQKVLQKMINFLRDFMWEYEWYLLAYDAFIYMGRANQILAETSDREKAEDYWKQCFSNIGKARSLLADKNLRDNPAVREISSRSFLFSMKARLAYGDTKRGPAATRQYTEAAKMADEYFRVFRGKPSDIGKAILVEQARATCKAGDLKTGIALLQKLVKQYPETWVESVAIDLLGEYAGEQDVSLAIDAAINFFDRGPAYHYRAVQKFRRAMTAIRKKEDQKFIPKCWYYIGQCYYYMNRYYEAIAALSELEQAKYANSIEAPDAAMLKLQCLARIYRFSKDPEDRKAMEAYRTRVSDKYPDRAGNQLTRQAAIDAERKLNFAEAVRLWQRLARPGAPSYEEAIFSVGFNLYRQGEEAIKAALKKSGSSRESGMKAAMEIWKKARDAFSKHLAEIDRLNTKDPRKMKNAVGSILFSCKILVHPRIDQADEALKISADIDKRFPKADPRLAIGIMSIRLDAKVKQGRVEEAEEDLNALEEKYRKERQGRAHYSRALAVLANAYEVAAAKEKDPEKKEIFETKAANFYYTWYQENPGEVKRPEQMEAMAQKLFAAAETRLSQGEARLGEEGMKTVRKMYSQALELYRGFLLEKERDLEETPEGEAIIRAINRRVTRCLLKTGKIDEAVAFYEDITQNDEEMKDGSSWEDLADCYIEKAKSPDATDAEELARKAENIYGQLAGALQTNNALNEHYWRLMVKYAKAKFERSPDDARKFFDIQDAKGIGPGWDDGKYGARTEFEALRKKLDAVVPPRN